jgi:hypothetical protein
MPTAFKNTDYYNLVNTILLEPNLVNKYTKEVLITDNLNRINKECFIIDRKIKSLYNLNAYLEWLGINLNKAEFNTLFKVLKNNTYKVRDLLINAIINAENTYFN